MKEFKNVKSQSKPVEIDDFSCNTIVFVRSNIKEVIEVDPVFKTEQKVYVYDETQYSYQEWYKLTLETLKTENNNIKMEIAKIYSIIESNGLDVKFEK